MDWFSRENSTPETIDFPINYGVFLHIFPSTNPLIVKRVSFQSVRSPVNPPEL